MIKIRNYEDEDVKQMWNLFYNTIRLVNIRDYTLEQVSAWAPDSFDESVWKLKMNSIKPFIAEIDGTLVGYADLQADGLISHFFCHSSYQGQGVGKALMKHILKQGKRRKLKRFYSEVSITAKPFYEYFGFSVVEEQSLNIRGQQLTNFLMEKR